MANKQRGSRVIYVAGSARELPMAAQEWLSRPDVKAMASPNIYDALAMLGLRHRPRVLVVSIAQVDWNELEFFDLAGRSSPETRIYVTGPESEQTKLDAAMARGAQMFDVAAVEEELHRAMLPTASMNTQEVLSQTILSIQQMPSEPSDRWQPEPSSPPPAEPVKEQESAETRPSMRLVAEPTTQESEEGPSASERIPFPWSPSPNRPKRTPPAERPPSTGPAGHASPPRANPQHSMPPVELTPDELAALVGKVAPPPAPKEQNS